MNTIPKPPARQKLVLQIVLTVVIFLGVINAALIVRNVETFVQSNARMNETLAYAFAVCWLVAAIGSFYVWGLKKWGLYVVCLAFVLIIGFNFYIGVEMQKLLLTLACFVLVIAAVIPLRNYFK
jgi:hypothetical protein